MELTSENLLVNLILLLEFFKAENFLHVSAPVSVFNDLLVLVLDF